MTDYTKEFAHPGDFNTTLSRSSVVDVSAEFDEFLDTIKLSGRPVERIESAISGVRSVAAAGLEFDESAVIVQGSFANGTATEPIEGGSYDVDLLLPAFDAPIGADAALDAVARVFLDNGTYKEKVEPKTPCIRLNYVDDEIGKFHVDLVPARPAAGDSAAPLEVPRRNEGWHETAPQEFCTWCEEQGEQFARTVLALKRWRDENQGVRAAIKSILLQVLVSNHLSSDEDDATRLANTLRNVANAVQWQIRPPVVPNPVLGSEDLASRWTDVAFADFKAKIVEAASLAEAALAQETLEDACDGWRNLLGADFPLATATEYGIELADESHARTYSVMGWTRSSNPSHLSIETHTVRVGNNGSRPRPYKQKVLSADAHRLRFRLQGVSVFDGEVHWQVVNTGGHARDDGGLRGGFHWAKSRWATPSDNPMENWEGTSYTGLHRIRAVVVRSNVVVAESQWIDVAIKARGVRFRR